MITGLGVITAMSLSPHPHLLGNSGYEPLLPCLCAFGVLAAGERLLRRRGRLPPTELSCRALCRTDPGRVALRSAGFVSTLALLALLYWLFPEYHGSFYDPYWNFLKALLPLAPLIPVYFYWVDRHAPETGDELLAFGSLLVGRFRNIDRTALFRHLLGWLVKGFFLPLMTVYLNDEMNVMSGLLRSSNASGMPGYDFWFHTSLTIDLLFCVIGYASTSRLFDSHIRSVEPTMAGWIVTLICYQPFLSVIGRLYLQYDGGLYWDQWLQPWPLLRGAWAIALIGLMMIYALCTVSFGMRFSNLTHRGIITGGPYRFSKHPAYLSKNLSWWMISVPYVAVAGWADALRHCLLLLLLNLVYFARARTEERHLSRDPTYVQYARWIDAHGALRTLGTLVPFLRYRAPPAE